MKTIAIVGGGFCGTMTAVNLARLSIEALRVVVVNDRFPMGRGVAYGTTHPEHLLNVVARNMSAFPDLPTHFVDWLRNRCEFADVPLAEVREQFVPRRVYGDYLQDILFWHVHPVAGPARVGIELVEDEVVDLEPATVGRGARVVLRSGDAVDADRVVLATGNPAPHDLVPPGPVRDHPAYCGNPWRGWQDRLPDAGEDVLLVGTGLTMIDGFLTLRSLGWRGTVHAVSRTGLLPLAHFKGSDYPAFPPEAIETMGLRELAELVEEHCTIVRAAGMNPAIVVDKLRPYTQRIWRNLSTADRKAFARHYRTRWNVVRHRIPPSVAAMIADAQDAGRLVVHKGKLGAVRCEGTRIVAAVEPGDGGSPRELAAALMVNCTGPRESPGDEPGALMRNLLERGLVRPDELDMGIEVTPDFAVVDREGRPSDVLFAMGPLLKGTLWETTAVPELRAQAHQVAGAVLSTRPRLQPDWAQETPENLVEYYI